VTGITETLVTGITETLVTGITETLVTGITETLVTGITETLVTGITETLAITATTAPAITARGDEVPEEMVAAMKAEKVDLPANDRAMEIAITKDGVLAGEEEALPTFRIF
jgi:hypothetical protein